MEELLSLKWNNHRSTFLHILAVLRDKQMYTDATLACDGKLYSVHKLVLSTCSDYFSSMLDRTACKSPVIVLKDIRSDDLEALLDYMYLGEVNVRQSDLATLIKAAECLRVKGLAVPDDEPPPRKVRGSETQSRRVDTIGSPPAKRKRRSEVDDGRDDGRPIIKQDIRRSSPVNSSASSRPKSPIINSHASPIRSNSTNNNNSQPITNNSTTAPRQTTDGTGDNFESVPYVKVEMEDDAVPDDGDTGDPGGGGGDSSTGDIGDSFNLSNDDFKEEDPDGADMNSDLPEFLQQANANYPQSSFAGPSFQPDLPWQQGNEGGGGSSGAAGLAGSFAAAAAAGLSFGNSSQQDSSAGAHNTSAGGGSSRDIQINCEDQLSCQVCGKLITGRNRRQRLQYHLLTHSGERRHVCPYCPYRALLKFTLHRHIRGVHRQIILQSSLSATPDASDAVMSAMSVGGSSDAVNLLTSHSHHPSSSMLPSFIPSSITPSSVSASSCGVYDVNLTSKSSNISMASVSRSIPYDLAIKPTASTHSTSSSKHVTNTDDDGSLINLTDPPRVSSDNKIGRSLQFSDLQNTAESGTGNVSFQQHSDVVNSGRNNSSGSSALLGVYRDSISPPSDPYVGPHSLTSPNQ